MTNVRLEMNWTKPMKLSARLMLGAAMLSLPSLALAAEEANTNTSASAPGTQSSQPIPPAPRGPFYSHSMTGQNGNIPMGNFPPMGFDPMNSPSSGAAPGGANAAPVQPAYPGNAYNSNVDGNIAGSGDVDIQIRGRIGMSGNGYGNQGWGNNFMHGMPFNHGYGAPYGTPFNQAYTPPQPVQPQTPPATDSADASTAPLAPPAQSQQQQMGQGAPVPFTWAPSSNSQMTPQMPEAPTRPQEPDWVKQQRAEMEKRQAEAQARMAEMQKNNPYAQQGYPRAYGQPYGQGYGAPYGMPYGTPYGKTPYGMPYGYAQQQQAAPNQKPAN